MVIQEKSEVCYLFFIISSRFSDKEISIFNLQKSIIGFIHFFKTLD
jgi:hypothetical protein